MQSVFKRQACGVTSQGALLSHLSKVELLYASSSMPPHPRANTPLTISPYSFPVTVSCLLLLYWHGLCLLLLLLLLLLPLLLMMLLRLQANSLPSHFCSKNVHI
jgi:hypothetical protein